ncbi:Lysophospholipase D gdpd1 [Phlyctochytrium bullatum]|nr:Lysophospholipase D gdpd1 [Phlyctochytrium bullatum]
MFWSKTFGKKIQFPHALMSHRGGSLEFVENTLPGFRYSANVLKVDLLELDVYMTKDKQVVVFHDSNLERLCGLPNKRIGDYEYSSLPPLLIPPYLKGKKEVVDDPDSTRIPRLEELFVEFPQ